jgi:hypothetical protein
VYYGQWAPELGQFDRFTGTVSRVSLNGLSLGNGRFKRSDVVRAELGRPAMELDVAAFERDPDRRNGPHLQHF